MHREMGPGTGIALALLLAGSGGPGNVPSVPVEPPNDIRRPPDSARQLEAALKGAGIADVRLSACGCASPPKSADIWLYVLEKSY